MTVRNARWFLDRVDFRAAGIAFIGVCMVSGAVLGAPGGGAATVFYDAQVFTGEPDHPYADAVAVRGERIVAVGDLAAVERAAGAMGNSLSPNPQIAIAPGSPPTRKLPLSKQIRGRLLKW